MYRARWTRPLLFLVILLLPIGSIASPFGEQSSEPRVDLYGNDVDAAVTDYRYDEASGLYESHSPDTEIPKLSPPTT